MTKLLRFNFYMLTDEQTSQLRNAFGDDLETKDALTNLCAKDAKEGVKLFDKFCDDYQADIAELVRFLQADLTVAIMNDSDFVKRGGIVIRKVIEDGEFNGFEVIKSLKQESVSLEEYKSNGDK